MLNKQYDAMADWTCGALLPGQQRKQPYIYIYGQPCCNNGDGSSIRLAETETYCALFGGILTTKPTGGLGSWQLRRRAAKASPTRMCVCVCSRLSQLIYTILRVVGELYICNNLRHAT